MEKSDSLLPPPSPVRQPPRRRLSTGFYLLLTTVCTGIALYSLGLGPQCMSAHRGAEVDFKDLCPQPSPLVPSKGEGLWKALGDKYSSKEFLGEAVELLGGAVRVP